MGFTPDSSKLAEEVFFCKIKKPNHLDLIFNNNKDLRYVFTTSLHVFS